MAVETRPIADLRIDGGTQMRVFISEDKVSEYRDHLKEGGELPPVVAFLDEDGNLWLSDGFHRRLGHIAAERTHIMVDVRSGTRRDAWLYSLSANSDHGMPRTNQDKRKALIAALRDEEIIAAMSTRAMSQHDLAKIVGVTQAMISKVVKELYPKGFDNRYQSADEIAAALRDDEKAEFIEHRFNDRDRYIHNPKLRGRMVTFGLWNEYGNNGEWTALADDVLSVLTANNPDYAVERELKLLSKTDRGYETYVHKFGRITRVLTRLIEFNGKYKTWMSYERAEDYDDRNWLKLLAIGGYARELALSDWDRWYHITPEGCHHLKLPYRMRIPDMDIEAFKAANVAEIEFVKQEERKRREAAEAVHGLKDGDIVSTPSGEATVTSVYGERVCTTRKGEDGFNQTNWIDAVNVKLVRAASEKKAASELVPEPPTPAPVMTDKEIERQWYHDNLGEDLPGDDQPVERSAGADFRTAALTQIWDALIDIQDALDVLDEDDPVAGFRIHIETMRGQLEEVAAP